MNCQLVSYGDPLNVCIISLADFTVVLTGTTGNGKSAACNFFMRKEAFASKCSFLSETKEMASGTATIEGKRIELVDTPGLLNPNSVENDKERLEFAKGLIKIKSGFHVLGLVLNVCKRIEASEDRLFKNLLLRYKDYLPYVVLFFTHGKVLGKTDQEQKKSLKDMIKEVQTSRLYEVLVKINHRYIIMESVDTMEEGYYTKKSKELVEMIDIIFKQTRKPATNQFALSMTENLNKVDVDEETLEKELADRIKTAQEMMKKDKSKTEEETNDKFYTYLKYAMIIGGGTLAVLLPANATIATLAISASAAVIGTVAAAAARASEKCSLQ